MSMQHIDQWGFSSSITENKDKRCVRSTKEHVVKHHIRRHILDWDFVLDLANKVVYSSGSQTFF